MSLIKLQEAGLINLEPGMVPTAFEKDNEKIMEKEESKKKEEEVAEKEENNGKGGIGLFFEQIIGSMKKSKEEMLEVRMERGMVE